LLEMPPRVSPTPILKAWLPPILLSLVILGLSGNLGSGRKTLGLLCWLLDNISFLSYEVIVELHVFLRKIAHILVYGILSFLYFRAVHHICGCP
jgi:hypothetical protein